jgi:hypothetical protein
MMMISEKGYEEHAMTIDDDGDDKEHDNRVNDD